MYLANPSYVSLYLCACLSVWLPAWLVGLLSVCLYIHSKEPASQPTNQPTKQPSERLTNQLDQVVYIMHMGHGQYLVYSSKSSIFEECIIVFQVLGI